MLYLNFTEIIDGGMWVFNNVTSSYNVWLSIPVLFPNAVYLVEEPTIFIAAAGIFITLLLTVAIHYRQSLFFTVLLTLPIVVLTFVITDLQPDVQYIIGLTAVYLTLLISGAIAPDDLNKRGLRTFPALAISLVFMIFIYFLSPYGNYIRSSHIINMGNSFRAFSSQAGPFGQLWQGGGGGSGLSWAGVFGGGLWQFNTDNINIADSGSRYITNKNLLEINVDRPGTFYIRGFSMGDFNGKSWSRDPLDLHSSSFDYDIDTVSWTDLSLFNSVARQMPAEIALYYTGTNADDVVVASNMEIRRTGDYTANVNYQPYYNLMPSNDMDSLNATERFFYINSVHTLVERLVSQGYPRPELGDFFNNRQLHNIDSYIDDDTAQILKHAAIQQLHKLYTYIDDDTAQGLRNIARENGIYTDAERYAVADAVARYIISSGAYTLSPEKVPDNENFVLYFLKEQSEGYCIHFATAAVLMLRALDIPARFVSGYTVTVSSHDVGVDVILTDENAHAWVEVFYEDIGWLYLETTPSAGNSYIPPTRPHTPQTDTTPRPQTPPPPTPGLENNQEPPEGPPPEDNTGGTASRPGVVQETQTFPLPDWAVNIVLFIACFLLIITALIIRRKIMLHIRKTRFEQADTNAAVLYIWRYLQKLGRSEAIPPRAIEETALKARFSQHRITEEERKEIVIYAKRLSYEIYIGKENDFSRLWLKYIRAFY